MAMYSLDAVRGLISEYIEKGGEVVELEEGTLGYGLTVLYGKGLKTAVVKEVFLNEWSSAHSVRMYNEMPQKYAALLEQEGIAV